MKMLIVGGGIGGLAAAIAAADRGFDVEVIERHADVHSSVYGVGIIQPINALRALDAIGCAAPCLEVGFATTAWGRMLDVDGELVREMPGVHLDGSELPPMNGLTRPQLHQILTDRANRAGARIRYSTTYAELADDGEGVTVTFADGGSGRYDLVVGADGAGSQVRSHVIGELKPVYLGQSAFRVNIPRLPEIDRIILQEGPRGMAGFVPIGPELAYLFYNSTMERGKYRHEEDRLVEILREELREFGGLTGRVRDELIDEDSEVVLRPEDWLIAPAPWHRGRVVLMGDAVHAITPHQGQGAAQAIEDGIVLAECLAAESSLDTALGRYTERRYERCKLIVESSVAIGRWEMGLDPGFDNVAVTQHVQEVMLQPI